MFLDGGTGEPGENPRIHGENMQTAHRKAPAGDRTWNPLAVTVTSSVPWTLMLSSNSTNAGFYTVTDKNLDGLCLLARRTRRLSCFPKKQLD